MTTNITLEARGYLERKAALERERERLSDSALLGDATAAVRVGEINREIAELAAKAESVMTPAKQKATQKRNTEEAARREADSHREHLARFVYEEVTRYRRQEYYRAGIAPSARTGRVEIPAALVAKKAGAVEDLMGATRVCGDDYQREAWYRQNFLSGVVDGTHDEVCQKTLGVSARYVRDADLDKQLGIVLDAQSGRLFDVKEGAEHVATG